MRPAAKPTTSAPELRTVRPVAAVTLVLGLLATGGAEARIRYIGGFGTTVYGVAPYGGAPQALPSFFGNNLSLFDDILTSPGGGFLTADPIIANNIFETPINVGLPLSSFQNGGGNGFGPFGTASTRINGPTINWRMQDRFAGGGSASYMISTWTANFRVDRGGFNPNGLLGNFLSVGGQVSSPNAAVAASLVSHFSLNGGPQGTATPLVLAAANNGNFQALGDASAVLRFGPGGTYRGYASNAFSDNQAFGRNLRPGDLLSVVTTVTAYADPASIDTFNIPLDPALIIPDFTFAGGGAIPEPATWLVMILGFFGLGASLRRRRAVVGEGSVSPG